MLRGNVNQLQTRGYEDNYIFDINDSIYQLRYRAITKEIKDEILDNELSFIEEGVNAPQQRTYKLHFNGSDILSETGKSLSDTLKNGELWAPTDITKRKAVADKKELEKIKLMMSAELGCNTLVAFRPFPEESSTPENRQELIDTGFQPDRKLGFMSIYKKKDETTVSVECISLDNTNAQVIREIALKYGQFIPQDILTDEFQAYPLQFNSADTSSLKEDLINLFDNLLTLETGLNHRQGRPMSEMQQNQVEIRQFIDKQPELTEWYWLELNKLAAQNLNPDIMKQKKKDLTYSFWAQLKERYVRPEIYNYAGRENIQINLSVPQNYWLISREVWESGQRAAARYEVLIGCGGAMRGSLSELSPEEALEFIFNSRNLNEDSNIPSLLKCINPKCRKTSKREQVIKADCWQCPHCGVRAICGKIEYPKEKVTKAEDLFKKREAASMDIAQTALK